MTTFGRLLRSTLVWTTAATLGCGVFGKKPAPDAGAATATDGASAPLPSAQPGHEREPKAGRLDATGCNPGTSLEPVDKGKTVQSDHFRYTLLDVRTDIVDNAFAKVKKVFLVKLQIENITQKPQLNTSMTDVDLTRDKAGADRVKEKPLHYKIDFFYPRPKMCVDLAGDVKPGMLPPGGKAIGYYAYGDTGEPMQSLWFSVRNVSPEAADRGNFLKVAGSLRIK